LRFEESASQRTRSMSSDSRAFSAASSTMRRRVPRWATATVTFDPRLPLSHSSMSAASGTANGTTTVLGT
jgi:hypothetical protein